MRHIVKVVNIGSNLKPQWRLKVDGVIVARAGNKDDLNGLRDELQASDRKAKAIRDHCMYAEAAQ